LIFLRNTHCSVFYSSLRHSKDCKYPFVSVVNSECFIPDAGRDPNFKVIPNLTIKQGEKVLVILVSSVVDL
jgi:hypothetical protein